MAAADAEAQEPDFTELGFRVAKLRVSMRVRRGELRQLPAPEIAGPVRRGPASEPSEQARHFRCRLSSNSSVTSADSGIASPLPRSRTNSSASSSSRSGHILRRIARAAIPMGTENAGFEFECFYNPSVSRTPSSASSSHSSVSRTPSSSSSRSGYPSTNPWLRSVSSSRGRARITSSDSSDYSDLYSTTIEELSDPFEEETPAPPPLPPRAARMRMRPPALPPYPSSQVTAGKNIPTTILC